MKNSWIENPNVENML
jgi:hypothetical protein